MFENITRVAARVGLHLSKSSPQLLAVGGVVSIAAGAVLLVRGALKSSETLEDFKKDLELIDQVAEEKPDQYSKEDRLRDTTIITMRYLQPLAKHLLPGIALIAVGTGALLGGHQILSKRNAALAAAFKATEKAYNEYRKRVADALGEREELSFRAATEDELSRETPPDGQEVDAAKAALERTSPYAKFFDESSEAWSKDVSVNVLTLKQAQELANRKLAAQGHLFLNEVYDMLGLKRTPAGAVVGWLHGNPEGDDFVDFGIFGRDEARIRDFFNGWAKGVLLDFNVDGLIYESI